MSKTKWYQKPVYLLVALALVLGFSLVTATPTAAAAADSTFTFPGGSLTTTNTDSWGGYNSHSYGAHFNVDAGPLTIEYLGVNAYPINYTGDFGWPPDSTDTGASVIVGVGNGIDIAQYSFKSNMSGKKPRGTDPETYGKGSWDHQDIGQWNDDGYRSYLFQGQFTDNWVETVGNSQYNAEKHGGPTGNDPDYDTFDFKFYVEKVALNTYEVTGWHNLWKSSAIDEGCYWDWNYAKNAHDAAKRGYLKCFEGTWTADGGLDLSDVQVFLAIQNWQGTQPELHTFDWDSVVVTGTVIPPDEVWVDGTWTGLNPGDPADGHIFGYDAFATIQDGIDNVVGSTVHVAAGTYDSSSETFPIVINKSLTLLGAQADVDPRPSEGGRTGGESIIDADETSSAVIQISAGDVEINGLTITGGMGDMVEESGSADNLLFRYNILYDDLTTAGDEAIQIKNSDSVVMEYNYAYNICQDAFNLSDSTNGAIRYNEAHDIHSENAAIYCYGSTGLEITGNLVYNVPNNDGIKLGDKNGADASKTGGLIKDNIVHGTRQDGISVYMSGVTVEGNEVYNSSSENGAIYLAFAISDITIRNNSVHDNELTPSVKSHVGGIGIESPVDAASVHINNNNIYKNTPYGVNNAASCVVDATSNWWGHASGPHDPDGTNEVPPCTADPATEMNADGTGDKVSDNVDYCPWLTAPYRPTMPMASFVIDHAKIDFKKKADDDKVRVQGKLELGANSNGVEVSEDVTVTEGPLSETITMVEKGKKGEKWEYKRPKGGEGNIKHMTIDWKNGKFDIRMDKADLTELTDPEVTISIQIGDDLGEETIMMRVKKHHWDYKAK